VRHERSNATEEDVDRKYFKAIIVSLIIISMFLIVWMNQWKYQVLPGGMLRINRITGKVYMLVDNGWRPLDQMLKKEGRRE
jgi:hypothetical protein